MTRQSSSDLLKRVKGPGGRSSLALAASPAPIPDPLPPAPQDPPAPVAQVQALEPVAQAPSQAPVLAAPPEPEVAVPAPRKPIEQPKAATIPPPEAPAAGVPQNTILAKLLGGQTPTLAASERGVVTSIRMDKQLESYIRKRYLKSGGKARLIDVVRGALLSTPVDPEVAQNGKIILAHRHKEFGVCRSSIEVPASVLESVNEEVESYATPSNMLRPASVIELRLLTWASQQPDWPPVAK